MSNWDRIIRFVAKDGQIYRGEPIISGPSYDVGKEFANGKTIKAKVVTGNIFSDAKVTDEILEVKELLGPLTSEGALLSSALE